MECIAALSGAQNRVVFMQTVRVLVEGLALPFTGIDIVMYACCRVLYVVWTIVADVVMVALSDLGGDVDAAVADEGQKSLDVVEVENKCDGVMREVTEWSDVLRSCESRGADQGKDSQ